MSDEANWSDGEDDLTKPQSLEKQISKSAVQRTKMGNRSTYKVYSDKNIITVVSVEVKRKWGYGFLTSIKVKINDGKDYEFNYKDFPRLSLDDIEDMYLLKVQGKLHHLKLEYENNFNNAFLLYIRRVMIKNIIEDTQLDNLQKIFKLNKLGRGYKNLMDKEWTVNDNKRSKAMVETIEKTMKQREQLRRLEGYVRGRPKTIDLRLLHLPRLVGARLCWGVMWVSEGGDGELGNEGKRWWCKWREILCNAQYFKRRLAGMEYC
nr:hypothetical protein [Tanacetum cinerariifolium]